MPYRQRRDKIFGGAPPCRLDRNGKHRVWARAKGLSRWNPQLRCRLITPAGMRVLEALLWRFHDADGSARCFPSYEAIAKIADCHRDTVCEAIHALEQTRLISWVHRLKRVRVLVEGVTGPQSETRVLRSSNGYQFVDTVPSCKTDSASGPPNRFNKKDGAHCRAQLLEPPVPPPVPAEPKIAAERSTAAADGAKLPVAERAAIVARMNAGVASKADWAAYERDLDARLR